jgi:hypothetical protein
MKLAGEIGAGVLVSGLLLALCTVLPVLVAIAVSIPFMAILAIAQIGEWREEGTSEGTEVMADSDSRVS